MKRLLAAALLLTAVLALSACGDVATQAPVNSAVSTNPAVSTDTATESVVPKIDIGFSLAGEDALSRQLATDLQSECGSRNLTAQISTAATAEQQQKDIQYMLAAGAKVIVIEPVDVDSLETVLAECETNSVRVINIIDPINGRVDMLISPNYTAIGQSAGQCAAELLTGSGGGCMLLNTEYDSLTMQLMSDGFKAGINGQGNISIVSEQFCGSDEELAFNTVKAELAAKDINFIFAQSTELAKGAMRAVEESGKDVKLAVFGGDMDIINAVSQSKVYASIFFSPGALAREVVSNADSIIKSNTSVLPQYTELSIVTVKQAGASGYYKEGAVHAEIN